MSGAQFQMRLAVGGAGAVNLTFQAAFTAVASGTYTVPSKPSMVVLCWDSQTNPITAAASCTISGHAATKIVEGIGAGITDTSSIWAAMVSPGDPNTWSVTQSNVLSSREVAFIYTSDATRINATDTFGSVSTFSHSANVGAGGSYVGTAGSLISAAGNHSWTLLSKDSDTGVGGVLDASAAHLNYVAAATSQTAAISAGGGASTASWAVVVFEP